MSIRLSLEVKGLRKFHEGIKNLPRNVMRAAEESLTLIGLLLEANSRDMCPVDTGSLRSAIGTFDTSYLVKELREEVGPENAIWEKGRNYVFVGTTVPYAHKVHDRVPWFESALRQSIGHIQEVIESAVAEGVERSFRGILIKKIAFITGLVHRRSGRRGRR